MLDTILRRGTLSAFVAALGLFACSTAQAQIASVTLENDKNVAEAYGGSDSTHILTVTLDSAAEAGGHPLTLMSSNAAIFLTTSDVTIPEGVTTASFPVVMTPTMVNPPVLAHVTVTDDVDTADSNDFLVKAMRPAFTMPLANPLQQGATYDLDFGVSARVNSDTEVTFSSDNAGVVVGNGTVTTGTSSSTFTATVSSTATGRVTITAMLNGKTVSRTLGISSLALKSVETVATATAGDTISVTVNLFQPAVGDKTIDLMFEGPSNGAPSTAVILSGQSSVTFNVSTKMFTGGSKVLKIKASFGAVTKSARVIVSGT